MSDITPLDNDESREIRLSMTMDNIQIPNNNGSEEQDGEGEE